jgi:hypothetical protein
VRARSVVGVRILGWSMVMLGAGHLSTVVLEASRAPDPATAQAMTALSRVAVVMPGPHRDLEQLFRGYSLLMGLMVVAFGLAVVWAARHLTGSPSSGSARAGLGRRTQQWMGRPSRHQVDRAAEDHGEIAGAGGRLIGGRWVSWVPGT